MARAAITRSRIEALGSPLGARANSVTETGATSICMSMRSSSGPDILLL